MSNSDKLDKTGARADRWLWCARFFKTRSKAVAALKAGHVKQNGVSIKPARLLRTGDVLDINIRPYTYTVTVETFSKTRGSAETAKELYTETEESRNGRENLARQLKLSGENRVNQAGRPDKRQRRKIIRFTRGAD